MGKIKVNVANGGVIEKPLITCFQGNSGNYIVLDNEANGSMGLPIICISKFDGNNLIKILDQNEWASVKECLKTIISGKNLPYLNVPETVTAGDDFYTQLTLPVASFDLLKSVYAPIVPEEPKEEVPATPDVAPAPVDAPVEPAAPVVSPMDEPATLGSIPTPTSVEEAAPVMPEVAPAADVTVPELPPVPEIPAIPTIPAVGEAPAAPVEPAAPVALETPVVEEAAPVTPAVEPVVMPEIVPAEVTPVEEAPADISMPVPETEAPAENAIDISAPVIMAEPLPEDPLAMMVPDPNATEAPVAPETSADPITMPTTEMVENTLVGESDDIAALKENFMKSCETMFDALIKKFENKKND